jgi:hypothetical protein
MPSPVFFKNFMKDALIISAIVILHARHTHASPTLAEPLDMSLHLPPAAPEPLSYRPRPPQTPHAEAVEEEPGGVFSMLQSIRSSLIRLETSLFYAAPCNATSPLAVACNATGDAPAPAHRADWLGRHHFGLRRQILSYTPPPSPAPPLDWGDATPAPADEPPLTAG